MAKKILVVDDEAPTRELLALFFRQQGYQVGTLSCGSTVLQELEKNPCDLMVLDVDLGDANGIDLLLPIKKARPSLPVIIFTGINFDEEIVQRARQNGASGFLGKTQPLDEMLKEVQRLLGT
jgi:DNA-binding NtrC family response regulator